ncbi:MAG: hypothetical protein QNJ63_00560 [Calothrix sp. MO_192.B10]|nr:hypothetical protein [Calothrix sp. MO_192.B10]
MCGLSLLRTDKSAQTIADGGSKRITQSHILPGLEISLLNKAFHMTRQTDQSQVIAWLLTQFQHGESS